MILSPFVLFFVDALILVHAFMKQLVDLFSGYERACYGRAIQVFVQLDGDNAAPMQTSVDMSTFWQRIWCMFCFLAFGRIPSLGDADADSNADSNDADGEESLVGYYKLFDGSTFIAKGQSLRTCIVNAELESARNRCYIATINGEIDISDVFNTLAGSMTFENRLTVRDLARFILHRIASAEQIVEIASSMLKKDGGVRLEIMDIGTMNEFAFKLDQVIDLELVRSSTSSLATTTQ